jgi:hypothetical protein
MSSPQERDRVSSVSDTASTLRLRRQELASKRAELEALLTAKRVPLLQLLGTMTMPQPVQVRGGDWRAGLRSANSQDCALNLSHWSPVHRALRPTPPALQIKAAADEALAKKRAALDAVRGRLQQADGRKRALQ